MIYKTIIVSLLVSCQGLFAQLKTELDGIEVTFPNISSEHFLLTTESNKVLISPVVNELPEGQAIQFSEPPERLEVKYKLGFLQYTIDDSPASALSFVHWTQYHVLQGFAFPLLYQTDKDLAEAHELIGFTSKQALANSVFIQNQKSITEESVFRQEVRYVEILNDSTYTKCCPEYLKQANEFMKADKASLNSPDKLNLELVYKVAELKATFQTKGRKKEIRIIIKLLSE